MWSELNWIAYDMTWVPVRKLPLDIMEYSDFYKNNFKTHLFLIACCIDRIHRLWQWMRLHGVLTHLSDLIHVAARIYVTCSCCRLLWAWSCQIINRWWVTYWNDSRYGWGWRVKARWRINWLKLLLLLLLLSCSCNEARYLSRNCCRWRWCDNWFDLLS